MQLSLLSLLLGMPGQGAGVQGIWGQSALLGGAASFEEAFGASLGQDAASQGGALPGSDFSEGDQEVFAGLGDPAMFGFFAAASPLVTEPNPLPGAPNGFGDAPAIEEGRGLVSPTELSALREALAFWETALGVSAPAAAPASVPPGEGRALAAQGEDPLPGFAVPQPESLSSSPPLAESASFDEGGAFLQAEEERAPAQPGVAFDEGGDAPVDAALRRVLEALAARGEGVGAPEELLEFSALSPEAKAMVKQVRALADGIYPALAAERGAPVRVSLASLRARAVDPAADSAVSLAPRSLPEQAAMAETEEAVTTGHHSALYAMGAAPSAGAPVAAAPGGAAVVDAALAGMAGARAAAEDASSAREHAPGHGEAAERAQGAGGALRLAVDSGAASWAARLAAHPHVADQVAVRIQSGVKNLGDRISIQLEPEALGKVHVRMDLNHEGKAHVVVGVENQQAFDLLQRDARSLERALQDAGLQLESGNLAFEFQGQQSGDGQGGEAFPASVDAPSPSAPEEAIYSTVGDYLISVSHGLNIRV